MEVKNKMAKQEKETKPEKKKSNWGWYVVGAIAIVIILIWVAGRASETDHGHPLDETSPLPVNIVVTEPGIEDGTTNGQTGLSNLAAAYCEEQGGVYTTEQVGEHAGNSICTVRSMKGKVFPWIVASWEAKCSIAFWVFI